MLTLHHHYNRYFFTEQWTPELNLDGFVQTRSHAEALAADCIVVHLASILSTNLAEQLVKLRQVAPARQVWVAEMLESASHYPQLDDPDFMSLFDIEMSYRQTADIWTPYIPHDLESGYRAVKPGTRRRQCCAFVSSKWDKSDRQNYMRDLMQQLDVHSFGRFMRNKRILFDRGEKTKLRVLKNYRYTLAFENSLMTDYVTEKFYQPLLTGTIPIYLGAPNIEEFAPGDNCFINAHDFASPAELAEFVRHADPAQFHHWRQRDLRPGFVERLELNKRPWKTSLAQMITERLELKR
ncbi:MAG: glycosyltransferase family 10 [Anderseniella sp.]